MNKTHVGIMIGFLCALISGVSIFVNKFAVNLVSPALSFTSIKNVLVAMILVAMVLFLGKYKQLSKLNRREVMGLLLVGIVGGTLPFYLYFTGMAQTSAINAAIIHKTLAIWVILYAVLKLREKVSTGLILAGVFIVGSNFLIGGFSGFKFNIGELMVLSATLLWSAENIIAKKVLRTIDPVILAAARMGIGSMILLPISIVLYPESLANMAKLSPDKLIVFGITVLLLVAYTVTWYSALKHLSLSLASIILASSTLVTNILTVTFITRTFVPLQVAQGGLVILGLAVMGFVMYRKSDQKELSTSVVQ